ncbi:MAG: DUF1684 domain-containing protein [Bacteroidota bacterium]
MYRSFFAAAFIVFFVAGCAADAASDWQTDVQTWKDRRFESLKKNWVSLAGLYWLDGDSLSVGSDAANDIVFPASAPPRIGTLLVQDSGVRIEMQPDVEVRHDGTPVRSLDLQTDADGEATRLDLDRLQWYVIEREGRLAVRLHDYGLSDGFTADHLSYFALDPAWRIEGRFEAAESETWLPVPTVMGTVVEMRSPGTIVFEVDGASQRLDLLEGGSDTYFVMFTDPTNRDSTYEAGRYVYIPQEDVDGRLVIDFNRAYNPPCAFTPHATCPYPPSQNHIPVNVEAGEKRYNRSTS